MAAVEPKPGADAAARAAAAGSAADAARPPSSRPCKRTRLPDLQPTDSWNYVRVGGDYVAQPFREGYEYMAYIMKRAIAELRTSKLSAPIRHDIWLRVDAEAKALEGTLDILDCDKTCEAPTGFPTLGRLRRDRDPLTQYTEAEKRAAEEKLLAWFRKPGSPLSALLSILAGEGFFFAAHAAEKTLRAWIDSRATKDDATAAASTQGGGGAAAGSAGASGGSAADGDAVDLNVI